MLNSRRLLALGVALALAPATARAADETRVTSEDDSKPVSVFFSVGWRFEDKLARIKREFEQPGRTDNGVEIVKDLKYERQRNLLNLRADFGLPWLDMAVFIEAPLVLGDTRTLSFDQDSDKGPCVFTGDQATCVNQGNSTTLNDMPGMPQPGAPTTLLPNTPMGWGLDASGSAPKLFTSGTKVFEGPNRSGLESLNLGLNWAVLNQRRDDTKPTWTVGFEARLQVTDTQKFNRSSSVNDTSVGLGYHVMRFQSFISKRFKHVDPYMGFWWEAPIVHSQDAFPDYTTPGSLGSMGGTGQKNVDPQQAAGTTFGFEAIAYENERDKQRIAIDFQGRLQAHFEGRGFSEMWEVFACNKADPPPFQSPLCFPANDPFMQQSFYGTTDIENYASFGGDLGVTMQVGDFVHFRAAFGADHDQGHIITFTDAGKDKNGDGMVDPNSKEEFNPLHRQQIDLVGRRYRVEDSTTYHVGVIGVLMF
jgi:hypothetical protein